MSTSHHRASTLWALGVAAAQLLLVGIGEAGAQAIDVGQSPRGPGFLIYGNYCGPGNRGPQFRPIDALDRACAHHDACWPRDPAVLPTCSCNGRLHGEAGLVAQDRHAPPKTREMARFIADFATAIPCDDGAGPRLPAMR